MYLIFNAFFSFRRIRVNAAFAGEPIPSEKSILKKYAITLSCVIWYVSIVTLINSTCSVPFLTQYALCMRYNLLEATLSWHHCRLLVIIPCTFIICTNILYDFDDISKPIFNESPLKTSCISLLFIASLLFQTMFLNCPDAFGILVILLLKGPLITIWTHHQLKQKSLKKNQRRKDVIELTTSPQKQYSQLENHPLDVL